MDFPGTKRRIRSALGLGRRCACATETPPPSPGKRFMGWGRARVPSATRRSSEARRLRDPNPVAARPEESKMLPQGRPRAPWLHGPEPRVLLGSLARPRRCLLSRNHWVGKILWRRAWQPTPVFLPGESYGQRSPVARLHSTGSQRVRHD